MDYDGQLQGISNTITLLEMFMPSQGVTNALPAKLDMLNNLFTMHMGGRQKCHVMKQVVQLL